MKLQIQVFYEKKNRTDLGLEEATAPEGWVILHWYASVGDWSDYIFTTNRYDIEENWINASNFQLTCAVTVPCRTVVS